MGLWGVDRRKVYVVYLFVIFVVTYTFIMCLFHCHGISTQRYNLPSKSVLEAYYAIVFIELVFSFYQTFMTIIQSKPLLYSQASTAFSGPYATKKGLDFLLHKPFPYHMFLKYLEL